MTGYPDRTALGEELPTIRELRLVSGHKGFFGTDLAAESAATALPVERPCSSGLFVPKSFSSLAS
jgi:hypothetical protein